MKRNLLAAIPVFGIFLIFCFYNRSTYEFISPSITPQDSTRINNSPQKKQATEQRQSQTNVRGGVRRLMKKTKTEVIQPPQTKKAVKLLGRRLQPVEQNDWTYLKKMPTYNQSKEVLQSDWWRAAAFLEIDFRRRPQDYNCQQNTRVGNWFLCQDEPFKIEKPCLVYSFGIANDFSFDDAMAELGCEVHSFDPSMNTKEHKRNTSVVFHPIGLSDSVIQDFNPRHDIYVTNDQKWNMMDLLSIMEKLGHKNVILDYLKIDVEGHEWSVLNYLIKTGMTSRIRHFSLEYHIFPDWPSKALYPDLLNTYRTLKEKGFYKYFTGIHPLNHIPKDFNIQADVCYINKNVQI
ncbi:probable methyltransferase-like protein 24 isoform X2 [Saccostrea cucullata]|uniref:probable methyltransferase-like protein 24 isoform X2 n=1 Tax=Saccostrea cuccullata TaxID=36930 RepID=UPI002ED04503